MVRVKGSKECSYVSGQRGRDNGLVRNHREYSLLQNPPTVWGGPTSRGTIIQEFSYLPED